MIAFADVTSCCYCFHLHNLLCKYRSLYLFLSFSVSFSLLPPAVNVSVFLLLNLLCQVSLSLGTPFFLLKVVFPPFSACLARVPSNAKQAAVEQVDENHWEVVAGDMLHREQPLPALFAVRLSMFLPGELTHGISLGSRLFSIV